MEREKLLHRYFLSFCAGKGAYFTGSVNEVYGLLRQGFLSLLFLFFGGAVVFASVAVPVSVTPFEAAILQGTPEQVERAVSSKIGEYQAAVNFLEGQLKASPKERETISQAIDLFQGVVYRLISLKGSISSPLEGPSSVPIKKGQPPYTLSDFQRALGSYYTLLQKMEECKQHKQLLKDEIGNLEEDVRDMKVLWVEAKSEAEPPFSCKYYLVLAQLVSTQVDYFSKEVELKHAVKRLEQLSSLSNKAEKMLNEMFSDLKITDDDLERAKDGLDKIRAKAESVRDLSRKRRRELNRQIVLLEIRKNRLLSSVKNGSLLTSDSSDSSLLSSNKEELNIALEGHRFRKELEFQKVVASELDLEAATFQYQWIKCYLKVCGRKERAKHLAEWKEKLAVLEDRVKRLNKDLALFQARMEILSSKAVVVKQGIVGAGAKFIKGIKGAKELDKAYMECISVLKHLTNIYQENVTKGRMLVLEMNLFLSFMRSKVGLADRFYSWFKEHGSTLYKEVRGIIYYPLWTVGQTPFTLATFLKFLFVLIIGILLVRLLRRKASAILVEQLSLSSGTVNSLTTLIYYFLMLVVFMVALSVVGINLKEVTWIVGALGVGVGFGLQNIVNNFVGGVVLLTERSIEIGDIVELEGDVIGEVKRINMRSTVIRTYDGMDIIVPNSEFMSGRVTTWTYEDDWRRLKIHFGVAYGSDIGKVEELALETAREVANTREDAHHVTEVWFEGFGASSLDFTLVVWVRMAHLKSKTGIFSDYYRTLYDKLNQAGIEIPFPQQDIHVRSIYSQAEDVLKKVKNQTP